MASSPKYGRTDDRNGNDDQPSVALKVDALSVSPNSQSDLSVVVANNPAKPAEAAKKIRRRRRGRNFNDLLAEVTRSRKRTLNLVGIIFAFSIASGGAASNLQRLHDALPTDILLHGEVKELLYASGGLAAGSTIVLLVSKGRRKGGDDEDEG